MERSAVSKSRGETSCTDEKQERERMSYPLYMMAFSSGRNEAPKNVAYEMVRLEACPQ